MHQTMTINTNPNPNPTFYDSGCRLEARDHGTGHLMFDLRKDPRTVGYLYRG